jgi:quinol monooxygenase YgiN
MILVFGSVTARAAQFFDTLALCQKHVQRSRQVQGCLSHAVHIDSENPLRLVFIERWENQDCIWAHVQSPETRAFVRALVGCVTAATRTEFFKTTALQRPGGKG